MKIDDEAPLLREMWKLVDISTYIEVVMDPQALVLSL